MRKGLGHKTIFSAETCSIGINSKLTILGASQVVQMVKNLPALGGDLGSIPGLGRSLEKDMETLSSILA